MGAPDILLELKAISTDHKKKKKKKLVLLFMSASNFSKQGDFFLSFLPLRCLPLFLFPPKF